jgi:dihydropteroate synthase
MLRRMVARVPGGALRTGTALLAVASLAEAAAAVGAGADLVDLGAAGDEIIAAFRRAHPGVGVCSDAGPGDLVRDRTALTAGALLLCADAAAATACGLPPGRLVVEAAPGAVAAAAAAGWAALVDADRSADRAWRLARGAGGELAGGMTAADDPAAAVAGLVAIASLSYWLGAAVVRTRHVRPVRRALDMAASIRGDQPPARAVRGLA